jgi:hypothetical protein
MRSQIISYALSPTLVLSLFVVSSKTAIPLGVVTCVGSTLAAAGTASLPRVGKNVQVSRAREKELHWEVVLCANPDNSQNLIAGSVVGEESPYRQPSVVVYTSNDGGAQWVETLYITGGDEPVVDPTCAFSSDHSVYFLAQKYGGQGSFPFYKSMDSGMNWTKLADIPRARMDRPYLTVDNTQGSTHGYLYLNAQGSDAATSTEGENGGRFEFKLLRSTDSGGSFLGPLRLTAKPDETITGLGNGVVLSDGTFVAVTGEDPLDLKRQERPYTSTGSLLAVSSSDGGASLLPTAKISSWFPDWRGLRTWAPNPTLAADSSSGVFRDRIYAVWSDRRSGRMEPWISHSSDEGKTWSRPLRIADDPIDTTGRDHFMGTVAVNASGIVGVLWYDRRDDPDNLDYWPRFSASLDGGESFLPSIKLSQAPASNKIPKMPLYSREYSRSKNGQVEIVLGVNERLFTGGDTAGLAASADGTFHALWVDNRTGISQVWTASVTVPGEATLNGFPELSMMTDVSDKVRLVFDNVMYDRLKHVVTAEVLLENTSMEPVPGPIAVSVMALDSPAGQISTVLSDTGVDGASSVWDFTKQLDNRILFPHMRSRRKHLEIRFCNPSERLESADGLVSLIQLRARIIAGKPSRMQPR